MCSQEPASPGLPPKLCSAPGRQVASVVFLQVATTHLNSLIFTDGQVGRSDFFKEKTRIHVFSWMFIEDLLYLTVLGARNGQELYHESAC